MSNILTQLAVSGAMDINTVGNVGTTSGDDLKNGIVQAINVVVGFLALVCVIVIIIGGVNYMTSTGDAGKVKKAKDTILYGLIGLIICVLAFAIVNFVILNIIKSN